MKPLQKVEYSREELQQAYLKWATGTPEWRSEEWDHYCDVRDGLPLGTTKSHKIDRYPSHLSQREMWN